MLGDLVEGAGDLEAAAAAPEGGLDRDRKAVLLGEGDHLVGVLDRVRGAGDERGPDLLRDVPSLDLVTERVDGRRRGTDPDQPGVEDGLREGGVLRQEAVAGMHRIGASVGGDLDDLLDRQVGLGRRGAPQGMSLVGKPHEQGVAVGVGVHRDRADAGVLARPDHAHRDLPAVGDEDLLQRLGLRHARDSSSFFIWVAWQGISPTQHREPKPVSDEVSP